ncbi:EAL domain-containing protein [Methylopila turkensis]|uniref:EAL domain-containing protein n=1 Tax=Methylopila turkensis TaxID=1437816 RepID=A0A9W6JNB1_9HYPH|nr:EAL domain-containing protein [Methylopila turkensis]GLK80776.1 hypothetical protein GCM10008174_25170 [Methylopila turkensis]
MTGIALAAVPIVGLNLVLGANIVTVAQDEADGVAAEILAVVEQRIDDAATALIKLGLKSPQGCGDGTRAALLSATLRSGAGAEVVAVDENERGECGAYAPPRIVRRISAEHGTRSSNVTFSAAGYGASGGPQLIQLVWRATPGAPGFRALLLGENLVPLILKSRLTGDFSIRAVMIDGTTVFRKSLGAAPSDGAATWRLPAVAASAASERYPLRIEVAAPGEALLAANASLFLYANLGGLAFALFVVAASVLLTRRGAGPLREIADGVRRREFVPYYQPVIDIAAGKLVGCEVLMRWKRRDGSVLAPGRFIALAEASGEIFPMTLSVMEAARDDLSEVYARLPQLELGFNLVAGHFDSTAIVDDVVRIFGSSAIRMNQLMFEVTERQPLQDITRARLVIARLQALGARVALDDVGTGHGGLSYLLKLGVDVMKMDKMFVDAIGTERYSVAIVDSLVKLADDMRLELVAEGVETFEQLEYLRAKGVRRAQGYVFAPPLSASSFVALVRAMHPGLADAAASTPMRDYVGPLRRTSSV